MANIKCIDVSEWQENIDWAKVKKAGIDCVILRAGFGREASQKDSEFEKHYKNAKAAGFKVGAYWYSYADSIADAKNEANACLKVIKGKTFELPIYYDMEDGSQTGFSKSTLTSMAKNFCDTIKSNGYSVGVYANANWFSNYLDYTSLKKLYSIWLAQYNSVAEFDCDVWQYASDGSVSGIPGNVDMNIIYNDKIIKSKEVETVVNYETAGIQALLMMANRLGLITQTISPLDNKCGKMTKAAILQMKKHLKMKENYTIDLTFIRKVYQALIDALPVVGDVNNDGKVNIKDATALQKQLAGIE